MELGALETVLNDKQLFFTPSEGGVHKDFLFQTTYSYAHTPVGFLHFSACEALAIQTHWLAK